MSIFSSFLILSMIKQITGKQINVISMSIKDIEKKSMEITFSKNLAKDKIPLLIKRERKIQPPILKYKWYPFNLSLNFANKNMLNDSVSK